MRDVRLPGLDEMEWEAAEFHRVWDSLAEAHGVVKFNKPWTHMSQGYRDCLRRTLRTLEQEGTLKRNWWGC
ncbi:MAG: hypothetical protein AB7I42_22730 [Bradyrhizobium sp.]|uniref:hypothetical protein n=1 Tax=Bradyrhizobium sp. TaxID=376 RepID=UPI003D0BA093